MNTKDDVRSGIIAGGNWLIDHVKTIDVWPPQDGLANILEVRHGNGGGPYNVLKDLRRLGATYPLEGVGLVGDDADGRLILDDCQRNGIDATQLRTTRSARTSYTDVMTERTTGRRTFFHDRGANALLAPESFDFSRTHARLFYLGYLLLLDGLDAPDPDAGGNAPLARRVFRAARQAGMQVALDCVSAPGARHRNVISPTLAEVDVLFANEQEAAQLVGNAVDPDDFASVEVAAHSLVRQGVRKMVVIHFPRGSCAALSDGTTLWQPAVRIPSELVAGSAGAGDAFAAGLLHGLHNQWPIAGALELAVCSAATSLLAPTCSDSVLPADEALAFGRGHGFLSKP
ncbi:carbohydrate kinase family protein [Nibricoccus sp. IMCC34717]|uniref:carbohydrate kinase family protein n=1 Tax=Nibricoccus sp. IMCC34717 TaxID=3034021 RepID=UPI0038505B4A